MIVWRIIPNTHIGSIIGGINNDILGGNLDHISENIKHTNNIGITVGISTYKHINGFIEAANIIAIISPPLIDTINPDTHPTNVLNHIKNTIEVNITIIWMKSRLKYQ